MKLKSLFPAVICIMLLSACSASDKSEQTMQAETKTIYAMDTVMTLKLYGDSAVKALDDAEKEIKRLDGALRRGSEDSEIYKVNEAKGAEVSMDTAALIKAALDICVSTDGAFDISIAPVMDLWGFYTKDFRVPSDGELSQTLTEVGYENISFDGNRICLSNNSQLDLGGIAKGYLSERIIKIFRDNGAESGIISLGGNVQTLGTKPDGSTWKVAIQDPDNDTYIGSVAVSDKSVVTSGGYQRFFEQDGVIYHHIIDPETGYPAQSGLKSVSIISKNGTLGDGLSTALFVMGLDKAMEYWRANEGFDVIFVTDDGGIYITDGLQDIFESEYEYSVITKLKLHS
ncbi:MAG: FAD:protein FMN transferase [Candidatus Ornithomonoglobus sp.]